MKYEKQIKGFFQRRRMFPISLTAMLVYYLLLEQFTVANFPKEMMIPIDRLTRELDLPEPAIAEARCELVQKGYLAAQKLPDRLGSTVFTLMSLDPSEYPETVSDSLLPIPAEPDVR